MRFLERLFASRVARIGVVLVWLVSGGLGGSFAQRFQNIQKNEESSFLPGSSASVKELNLAKRFPSDERFTAVTVIRRDGGLTAEDLAAIEGVRASLAASPPVTDSRAVLVRVSPDHTTALLIINLNPRGQETLLTSSVGQVESRVAPLRSRGLTVKVSGPAGVSRDAVDVFASINGTLLLATAGLVFVLLIVIYRSPVFWFIPLFSVLMAEALSLCRKASSGCSARSSAMTLARGCRFGVRGLVGAPGNAAADRRADPAAGAVRSGAQAALAAQACARRLSRGARARTEQQRAGREHRPHARAGWGDACA